MPLKAAALTGFLIANLAALGCGESEPDEPPSAIIGAGETSFTDLADGDTGSVILGPQGGFHLIGSVQVRGINPGDPGDLGNADNPTTTFTIERGGQRIDAGASSYTQGLDAAGDGSFEMVGRIVILDILSDDEVDGDTLEFIVTVTSPSGRTASDRVSLVGAPDPRNPIQAAALAL